MTPRRLASLLLPPIVADGVRGARAWMRARRAPAAPAPEWSRVRGGVLDGFELRLPAGGERWVRAMLSSAYEPAVTEALADAIRPGDVCYDLGAHLGYHALVMAGRAGPRGTVHAFEPYPPSAVRLREHAARNADPERRAPIHVHEAAVAGVTGTRALVASGGADDVDSTLSHLEGAAGVLNPAWRRRFEKEFTRADVRAWRLDDWRAEVGAPPPDVIKLDVEGSEMDALRGARETLAAARPVIVAELHNAALAAECGAFLGALGYALEVMVRESAGDCIIRATAG